MMRVSEILEAKGGQVVTIASDATVRELVTMLATHNIGAALVTDPDHPIAGIVSERDVVRALPDIGVLDRPVADIMTADVQTATPDQQVHELARLMTEHRIRHVPVLDGDRLCGVVSIGDVVKSRIDELEFERDQLSSYVAGAQ